MKIIKFSGNSIDYLQDLAFSFYKRFQGKNPIINIAAGLFLAPLGIVLRWFVALFLASLAEISTYVVRHSQRGRF
ncbi:hypothetical protein UR09_06655 [Candidatus Nitromaritima sp. SCGC AAA799-A02]|nr:hypothetical protein UR09_06655 [Candidatus Nitromaritima sp. SCGC AAA799-A02]